MTTDHTNQLCPDHTAHSQNAADQLWPAGPPDVLTADEAEAVDALAEAEYLACEGH